MSELTTDLKSLNEATLNNLKSSKANNTLRAYKSDFRDYLKLPHEVILVLLLFHSYNYY